MECQEADLNRRHEDFQSSALPTELSRLVFHFYHSSKSERVWQPPREKFFDKVNETEAIADRMAT